LFRSRAGLADEALFARLRLERKRAREDEMGTAALEFAEIYGFFFELRIYGFWRNRKAEVYTFRDLIAFY
jgi:hypothetical protein